MDGTTLNSRIYNGYAKAASHIGQLQAQYRPASAISPLTASIGNLLASFNIGGQYANQAKADVLMWQAILDGSQVQIGDYLVGEHTWAIIGMEPLMPVIALRCTDKVTVSRGSRSFTTADGLSQTETVIAQDLPCYVQLKRDKGFGSPAGFPAPTNTSAPMPAWFVYVCLGGVTPAGFFKEGDVVTASSGQKWKIDAASSSTVMWQLACVPYEPNA